MANTYMQQVAEAMQQTDYRARSSEQEKEGTMQMQTATPRRFWLWLIIFLVYLVIESIGFYLIPHLMGYKGTVPIFALNNPPPYSASQAYAYIAAYGSTGRAAYSVAMVFDVLFPFLYAMVLSVGLRLVMGSMHLPQSIRRVAGTFPFLAAVANWIADIFILILLNYSGRSDVIATIASVLTSLKFLVIAISLISVLIGGVYLLVRKMFHSFR